MLNRYIIGQTIKEHLKLGCPSRIRTLTLASKGPCAAITPSGNAFDGIPRSRDGSPSGRRARPRQRSKRVRPKDGFLQKPAHHTHPPWKSQPPRSRRGSSQESRLKAGLRTPSRMESTLRRARRNPRGGRKSAARPVFSCSPPRTVYSPPLFCRPRRTRPGRGSAW